MKRHFEENLRNIIGILSTIIFFHTHIFGFPHFTAFLRGFHNQYQHKISQCEPFAESTSVTGNAKREKVTDLTVRQRECAYGDQRARPSISPLPTTRVSEPVGRRLFTVESRKSASKSASEEVNEPYRASVRPSVS